MKLSRLCPLIALFALLLPGCKPSVHSLRHISLRGCTFEVYSASLDEEAQQVVAHYLQTGDANYASPIHRLTMLHIAAGTQRLWLVDKLLAEGADPNARMRREEQDLGGDTPLMLAVRAGAEQNNTDALHIVKTLMDKGADINIGLSEGRSVLTACGPVNTYKRPGELSGEELLLELMKLGARPSCGTALRCVSCWPKALEALLTSGDAALIHAEMPELLTHAASSFDAEENELDCAVVLLRHCEDVNARDREGRTALYQMADNYHDWRARCTTDEPDEEKHASYTRFFKILLDKGADPLARSGQYGESCAADFMALHPDLLHLLAATGRCIAAPAHHFREERVVQQLIDIPADAVTTEEARAHYELLSSFFCSPSETLLAHKLAYREACAKALTLMLKADAGKTRELLRAHPALEAPAAWQGDADAARGLLLALMSNKELILPAPVLVDCARRMEEAGKLRVAHAFIRLLGRDQSAAGLIEQLCAEGTPLPLRAAAWSSRLELSDLPPLGQSNEWFKTHSIYSIPGYHIIRNARDVEHTAVTHRGMGLVERPECLFYDSEFGEQQLNELVRAHAGADCVKALREMEAPFTAHLLSADEKEPLPELPAELATIRERWGDYTAASLEVELAVAQYLWEHRAQLSEEFDKAEPAPERE